MTLWLTVCAPVVWSQQGPIMFGSGMGEVQEVEADAGYDVGTRLAVLPPDPELLPPLEGFSGQPLLTLLEVEDLALAYHPAVREAEADVRALSGNWLQVGLRPNPRIGYSGNEIGDDGTAGQQGGYFSQQFITSNKLGLNRAVAKREVAAAEQRLARARLRVLVRVRQLYIEALAAERAKGLAGQFEAMATQAIQASQMRFDAGEGTRGELLQSQIEGDSAVLLELQAVNQSEAAWRMLSAAIGLENQPPRALDDVLNETLPVVDWESARARLLGESPELAEAFFEVDRAQWAVERAVAGRVPDVNVQAGVGYDNSTHDTITGVQLSMPLPIYDRNQGRIAQARGELAAARAALDRKEIALEQRLATALQDYDSARARVSKYTESILPAARQSLELTTQAYEQGELGYLELLTVQRTYTQKNIDFLRDLKSAWKKWTEIEGFLVTSSVESSD